MATRTRAKAALKGKARLRAKIIEAMQGLHKVGAVSDAELEKTTLRMLGRDALPKVADLTPADIDPKSSGRRARSDAVKVPILAILM
jgi:hypothetical protein